MTDTTFDTGMDAGMASETTRDNYAGGLVNAHALEKQAIQLIDRQLDRLENYPEVAAVLRQHRVESEAQIERLDRLMAEVGTSESTIKNLATEVVGNLAALGHAVMPDEVMKNHFANCGFEHTEQAAYRSLIAMARAAGHDDHVPVLQQSLQEEERTGQTLLGMTESLTLKYMMRAEAGETAGR